MGVGLSADKMATAMLAIRQWREAPGRSVACPVCGSPGLTILDRSARPFAEWYVLSCRSCALDDTIHVPMAPPRSNGD